MEPRALADHVCQTLRTAGHQAYLVGGCVRDILLGRLPIDYDVATDAAPERIRELFSSETVVIGVGAKFGVMLVVDPEGRLEEPLLAVEVATFRSDLGYSDGRHPDRVVYTKTAEEDVKRRDFTINALLMNPETGEVLDFVGGRADLKAGIIRAIGNPAQRFEEDKLRMIRAVRFAARFRYEIEAGTLAAIQRLAGAVSLVSAERIRDELTKILTEGAARRGFELLDETRLLREILPEITKMKGVEQPPEFHPEGDVWIHTLMMIGQLRKECSPALAWGVLLHDVGKPPTFKPPAGPGGRIRFDEHAEVGTVMAEEICRRLRFSNDETEQIAALVANHMRFKDVLQMKPATLKRFVRLERFEEHMELHRLDCLSSHRMLGNYEFVRKFLDETPPEQVRPPRLLTGEDLKEMGFSPGPLFRTILNSVEEAQLEGRIRTPDEARELVAQEFPH